MYAGKNDLTIPYISPLYGNFSDFPPTLIQCSTSEMLYDDSLSLHHKLIAANRNSILQEWDGLMHWWHLFQKLIPEANEAVEKIVKYINEIYSH
jgi:acetyl esterase/lipase